MDCVLLLNNAYYVDSIKDTWAKGAGHYSYSIGNLVRVASQHPLCKFGAVTKELVGTYL